MGALLNDNKYHAVIIYRHEANLTLYIDSSEPIYYSPPGNLLGIFSKNDQSFPLVFLKLEYREILEILEISVVTLKYIKQRRARETESRQPTK